MHQLLRYRSTGGDYITSDLLRLLPNNLVNDTTNGPTRRNLLTLASFDLDRPGVTPYIWDPTSATQPSAPYLMNTALTPPYPQGGDRLPAAGEPGGPVPPGTVPAGSEFDQANWRSLLSTLGRINLNRPLTAFPPPDNTGVVTAANQAQALQALADRQQFASDIFTRLVQVTTGYQTPGPACLAAYNIAPIGQSTQYQALRYLAQLSANIVDYIDTDDQSTPFNWYNPTTPMTGQTAPIPEWVFGTENPRLLINEAYAQYDNSPQDPTLQGTTYVAANPYNVNVWIELFNPLLADPVSSTATTGTQDTTARLQTNVATPQNLYQVVLANPAAAAQTTPPTLPSPLLANPANTIGNPNFQLTGTQTNIYTQANGQPSLVSNFGTGGTATSDSTGTVPPLPAPPTMAPPQGAGNPGNIGFYCLGPLQTNFMTGKVPPGNTTTFQAFPNLPVTFNSAAMSYTVPLANAPTLTNLPPPIVLLQRLACPLLPPNNNPASPTYNPFITIDSFAFQPGQINDARYFDTNGPITTANTPQLPVSSRVSYGRVTSRSETSRLRCHPRPMRRSIQSPSVASNSFFSHNSPLANPFAWNTHLDRNLISPVELLFVHGARPMDLTAQFVDSNDLLNQARYAPWLDQQSRLHRFLEIAETTPHYDRGGPLGTHPGTRSTSMASGHPNLGNPMCSMLCATPNPATSSRLAT